MRAAPCAPLTSLTEPGIQQVLHSYVLGANIQKVSLRRSLLKAESLPESSRKLYVPKGRYVLEDSRLPFSLEGKKSPVCPRGGWHALLSPLYDVVSQHSPRLEAARAGLCFRAGMPLLPRRTLSPGGSHFPASQPASERAAAYQVKIGGALFPLDPSIFTRGG